MFYTIELHATWFSAGSATCKATAGVCARTPLTPTRFTNTRFSVALGGPGSRCVEGKGELTQCKQQGEPIHFNQWCHWLKCIFLWELRVAFCLHAEWAHLCLLHILGLVMPPEWLLTRTYLDSTLFNMDIVVVLSHASISRVSLSYIGS